MPAGWQSIYNDLIDKLAKLKPELDVLQAEQVIDRTSIKLGPESVIGSAAIA